jgi:hypothetical protein
MHGGESKKSLSQSSRRWGWNNHRPKRFVLNAIIFIYEYIKLESLTLRRGQDFSIARRSIIHSGQA